MKKIFLLLTFISNAIAIDNWIDKCQKLPKCKELIDQKDLFVNAGIVGGNNLKTIIDFKEFETCLQSYFYAINNSNLINTELWLNQANISGIYAEKLVVNYDDKIYMHGDLHADIHSLVKFLSDIKHNFEHNSFKLINKNIKIIFLGDYTDKGIYGLEVLFTLIKLKTANPDQVFLVRGNHENIEINQRCGFTQEFFSKYIDESHADKTDCFNNIIKFYNTLPAVIYLGYNQQFLQCCHGGIEVGYTPNKLLSTIDKKYEAIYKFDRETNCKKLIKYNCSKHAHDNLMTYFSEDRYSNIFYNGFMWSDFDPIATNQLSIQRGRGIMFDKQTALSYLGLCQGDNYALCGIFRAHQHTAYNQDPLMQQMLKSFGIARLWSKNQTRVFHPWYGIVCTFLVSPDNCFGISNNYFDGLKFDTYAKIIPAENFKDWTITCINNTIL